MRRGDHRRDLREFWYDKCMVDNEVRKVRLASKVCVVLAVGNEYLGCG
jgi:hypothetical protein